MDIGRTRKPKKNKPTFPIQSPNPKKIKHNTNQSKTSKEKFPLLPPRNHTKTKPNSNQQRTSEQGENPLPLPNYPESPKIIQTQNLKT